MANEIKINVTASVAKGNVATKSLSASISATLTGSNYEVRSQSIPTTAGGTAIDLTGLTTPRWLMIKNNDAANNLDFLSAVSGTVVATMLPGECIVVPLNSTISAPALLAHTAAIQAEYLAIEN